MATTPARMNIQGGAGTEAPGTRDTERPPGVLDDEKTDTDALGALGNLRRSEPELPASGVIQPEKPGESTKVGPAPDPAAHLGPPSPRNLRAAGPPTGSPSTKLAAARPPPVRTASGQLARPATVPMPLDPLLTPGPPPTVAPQKHVVIPEGTAVGLAPSPGQIAAASAGRVSTRAIEAAKENKPLTRRCTSCSELYPADFLVCPRDATPLVAVDGTEEAGVDPLVGALIGETYQIVRTIGEGGMGRVYEARHLRLKERRFAVKCLHAELARNGEMAARFLREAESASSIKHHNVVDVFDVHHLADGTPYLVGEYLEGEELADYVTKRGPLDPRQAAKIARQVCHALAAAHQRGIVHRDMKPENIFVLASSIAAVDRGESRTLQIKVLDFGISKAGHGDTSHLTRTGVIMGTPSYMSPEQARGRPVDHRADIYSLGACLYYMVTARRPFDSDDPTSTLSMVLTEDPVRPREIDQRIPEMLELIIQRAMAKDANDRYSSMSDLEKALALFTGKSSLAVPSGHGMIPMAVPTPPEVQRTGAFDLAKAMLGNPESLAPPSMQLAQTGNLARTARPTIVVTSATLGAWLVGGTVAALAGLVRVLHDGEVTLTESLLLVVGCLFAAATPIALYVMHLRKVIWPNSVRALQLATDLRRITISALVTYGGLAIGGRIVHTVFARSSRGLASGLWDIALFVVSVTVALSLGGLAPLLRNLRRRRPSMD
jgi:serine/threonine protein kinase